MPNWCECEVRVAGPVERVEEFLEFARGDGDGVASAFDFNRFIPYPPEWRRLDDAFLAWQRGGPGRPAEPPVHAYWRWGFHWCCDNWGTESNARHATRGEVRVAGGGATAAVSFLTAWCEPGPVVRRASELFPDLEFDLRYSEPLGDFAGRYRCRGGVGRDAVWCPSDHAGEH